MPPLPAAAGQELAPAAQAAMVQALQRSLQARQPLASVELIETHISFVLITAEHAYKFKKALATDFLDYSTLALRLHCCTEELRLNRRLAPELYLGVVAVTGSPAAPELDGAGPMIDCAVQMRAFSRDGLWDRLATAGELKPAHIDELAALLCRFHAAAAVAPGNGRLGAPAQVRVPMQDNLLSLTQLLPEARAILEELRAWEAQVWDALEPVFAERLRSGRVRECHGDLHLGNVTLIDGRSTVFDGIEFNDDFRWIDVISELAFMAMDLHGHGLHALAHRLVNGYLQGSGDYAGARVLGYYTVHRGLVRAKVAALRAAQSANAGKPKAAAAARHYLQLALRCSRPGHPALLITHGFSGSGKTTLTQSLLEAAGAIRIRADIERKRLAGLDALASSRSAPGLGLYSAEMTAATQARLLQAALPVMQGGWPALLDATFLRRQHRDDARHLAVAAGVPFFILDFEAEPAVLQQRVRQRQARGDDASEADESVLQLQLQTAEPLQADETAAVFRCVVPAQTPPTEPRPDWKPLLARLAQAPYFVPKILSPASPSPGMM